MAIPFDIENDNVRFFRIARRVFAMFAVLICIYLSVLVTSILMDNPSYLHNWRGLVCIVLTALAMLIYLIQFRNSLRMDWPPPLPYAIGMWLSLYLVVLLLALINRNFVWDFYVVYAIGFGLFGGKRLLLAVSCMALSLFAFQGLLLWPPTSDALVNLASQSVTLFSLTGLNLMFQHLVQERFQRNELFQRLAQANSELEEAHRLLSQSVEQEQELAVLRERTRLAREMHDTIGHALVLLSVKLEAIQRLRERDPERCDSELESSKHVVRETMSALRASIADLRSPTLEHIPIQQALKRSATELGQRATLTVTCEFEEEIGPLPASIEETLWKVSQEAFTNIEKHAHARNVHVCINRQDENLLLRIHDDGIGLPLALCQAMQDGNHLYMSPGHYGLRGMRERVEAIDGCLLLHANEEQGTTVAVELPLEKRGR